MSSLNFDVFRKMYRIFDRIKITSIVNNAEVSESWGEVVYGNGSDVLISYEHSLHRAGRNTVCWYQRVVPLSSC